MSRIGKVPVAIPDKVKVNISETKITVEGPKGKLEQSSFEGVSIKVEDNQVVCSIDEYSSKKKAMFGLARAMVANMVKGVSEGFSKKLEINGVGYRVQAKGNVLDLTIGKSHQVLYEVPSDLNVTVTDQTHFEISGADKQKVGQVAANIRALYPPEPYKGKGIKYEGEHIRRKAGKSVG